MSRLLGRPTPLVMLEGIPQSSSISDVIIDRSLNTEQTAPLTNENFAELLNSARPMNPTDEAIQAFHYAPWHNVRFSTLNGEYRMMLFLGGRGYLLQPNGEVGAFDFKHPKR